MSETVLNAQARNIGSKGSLSNLRKNGNIPAVFYGKGLKPESITVNAKDFLTILTQNGNNVVIDLKIEDITKPALVKFLQRDILTQQPLHIDFKCISLDEKVEVSVPVHIEGVPDGVKNFGGLMEFLEREVKVFALPKSIPQKITVDVSALGLGQAITVADLPKFENVDYLQDASTLIVHVVAVSADKEQSTDAAAASTEVAQPEVIGKGKKDKEAEAGSESGKPK
ncbi:MAG: 50S ribosomal protein L25 [Elusimicrobiota bacterium]|jgi:large subunit ribosomal protein L25|nr:50S ribosomal protein L25 [Elusimicrobiota bacterium]